MPPSSDKIRAVRAPVSLSSMQVDVTTRLGALAPATPTGFPSLDRMLTGGLRAGTLLTITGEPGVGKTAFALLLAYMAARSRAATVFASAVLDETEVVARLAARAMYREYPDSETPYGAIWSGQAWQDDFTRAAVGTSVNVAVRKVGQLLHLMRLRPFETTQDLSTATSILWERHERVVVVVDGMEALSGAVGGEAMRAASANASYENRIAQVAYELRLLAEGGCAVVVTAEQDTARFILPAATLAVELRSSIRSESALSAREQALGTRPLDAVVLKSRLGPSGVIPLRFIAGASLLEEVKEPAL